VHIRPRKGMKPTTLLKRKPTWRRKRGALWRPKPVPDPRVKDEVVVRLEEDRDPIEEYIATSGIPWQNGLPDVDGLDSEGWSYNNREGIRWRYEGPSAITEYLLKIPPPQWRPSEEDDEVPCLRTRLGFLKCPTPPSWSRWRYSPTPGCTCGLCGYWMDPNAKRIFSSIVIGTTDGPFFVDCKPPF
jgi:hypothetical protein